MLGDERSEKGSMLVFEKLLSCDGFPEDKVRQKKVNKIHTVTSQPVTVCLCLSVAHTHSLTYLLFLVMV